MTWFRNCRFRLKICLINHVSAESLQLGGWYPRVVIAHQQKYPSYVYTGQEYQSYIVAMLTLSIQVSDPTLHCCHVIMLSTLGCDYNFVLRSCNNSITECVPTWHICLVIIVLWLCWSTSFWNCDLTCHNLFTLVFWLCLSTSFSHRCLTCHNSFTVGANISIITYTFVVYIRWSTILTKVAGLLLMKEVVWFNLWCLTPFSTIL